MRPLAETVNTPVVPEPTTLVTPVPPIWGLLFVAVGAYKMPVAVIVAPPSEVTLPPSVALAAAMLALVGVETVANPTPVKIYAAPVSGEVSLAPTTTVSADTATAAPNKSFAAVLLALR